MKVRALVDIPGTDIKSGEFFEVADAVVKAMVEAGEVDPKAKESEVYGDEPTPAAKVHPSAVKLEPSGPAKK